MTSGTTYVRMTSLGRVLELIVFCIVFPPVRPRALQGGSVNVLSLLNFLNQAIDIAMVMVMVIIIIIVIIIVVNLIIPLV